MKHSQQIPGVGIIPQSCFFLSAGQQLENGLVEGEFNFFIFPIEERLVIFQRGIHSALMLPVNRHDLRQITDFPIFCMKQMHIPVTGINSLWKHL